MRRILITLTLLIILWAVFRLNRLVKDWHYVVPAEPGELLYVAAFDDDSSDWEQAEGNQMSAQLVDGMMRISVRSAGRGQMATANPHFGDFDIQTQARMREGIFDGNNENGYGIIFRRHDPENYYVFLVSNDGSYRVRRIADGVPFLLNDWVWTDAINTDLGALNTLRVVGDGDVFQFYINGELMQVCVPDDPGGESTTYGDICYGAMRDRVSDDTIASGQLGVYVEMDRSQTTGVIVDFDNVIVYGPQPVDSE